MRVSNTRRVELSHQVVHCLRPANQCTEWKFVVGAGILDLLDFTRIGPNSLQHAAHSPNKPDLLLEDCHAVFLSCSYLLLFVLLGLLLLQNSLHILSHLDTIRRSYLACSTLFHQVFHHVANLLHEEGNGPFEQVHALRQVEWVHDILVLFNVHFVVFNKDDCALVIVLATVVWRAKDRDDTGEGLMTAPSMHLVPINLDLMRPNHTNEVVGAQDLLYRV